MKHPPHVILGVSTTVAWGRSAMRGVVAYAERHGPWNCDLHPARQFSVALLRQLGKADGLIIHSADCRRALAVIGSHVPTVAIGITGPTSVPPHVPHLYENALESSRLACDYFVGRGFRQFAFYAFRGFHTARWRGHAFVREVQSRGYSCAWFEKKEKRASETVNDRKLNEWVANLPKPVAIVASWDGAAREVTVACRKQGIRVPEDVAVLGLGNDEYQCLLCSPQISSVDPGVEHLGYEAASLLDKMLKGRRVKGGPRLFSPVRVVTRHTTDVISVDDEKVAAAVRRIHERLAQGVNVKQLVQELDVGRRTLELAFEKHLGRTVHAEIVRAQLERASRLLEDGELSVGEIARRCGIQHSPHFCAFFKKNTGITPLEYRSRNQRQRYQGIP